MTKYNVEVDYWNGGKEIVTGEPVEWEQALQIKRELLLESKSGEFFVNILEEVI